MHHSLTVDLCVGIRDGCPVTYLITADNQAEFSFGGVRDGVTCAFEPASLRAFLMLGAEALAEMEGRKPGPRDDRATLALVTAGGQSV